MTVCSNVLSARQMIESSNQNGRVDEAECRDWKSNELNRVDLLDIAEYTRVPLEFVEYLSSAIDPYRVCFDFLSKLIFKSEQRLSSTGTSTLKADLRPSLSNICRATASRQPRRKSSVSSAYSRSSFTM